MDAPIYAHENNVARRAVEPLGLEVGEGEEDNDGGQWEGNEQDGFNFVVDFAACTKQHFAILKVTNDVTKVRSIELYKIKKITKENKTFLCVMWESTKDQQTNECSGGSGMQNKARCQQLRTTIT